MAALAWELITDQFYPPKDTRVSFNGRNIIVTGANVGLGFEAAAKFVDLGADKVILAVRTLPMGEEAQRLIESRTGRRGEPASNLYSAHHKIVYYRKHTR